MGISAEEMKQSPGEVTDESMMKCSMERQRFIGQEY